MKKIILFSLSFFLIAVYAHGITPTMDRKIDWFTDAYHYGKNGNSCSRIYYEYGTPNWTFNADDTELLKEIHNACVMGKNDKESNQNNLPLIIDSLNNAQ